MDQPELTEAELRLIAIGAQLMAIARGCLWNGDHAECNWRECDRGCSIKPTARDYRFAAHLLGLGRSLARKATADDAAIFDKALMKSVKIVKSEK